jgi:hypothetical protein
MQSGIFLSWKTGLVWMAPVKVKMGQLLQYTLILCLLQLTLGLLKDEKMKRTLIWEWRLSNDDSTHVLFWQTPMCGGNGTNGRRRLIGWPCKASTCHWLLLVKRQSGKEYFRLIIYFSSQILWIYIANLHL